MQVTGKPIPRSSPYSQRESPPISIPIRATSTPSASTQSAIFCPVGDLLRLRDDGALPE